jgi:Cu/Ag efflux pump CusA
LNESERFQTGLDHCGMPAAVGALLAGAVLYVFLGNLRLAVFLIFLLLFDTFKSVKDATLILLNVPFALIGGLLGLYFTGIPLSVSAAIGFIALSQEIGSEVQKPLAIVVIGGLISATTLTLFLLPVLYLLFPGPAPERNGTKGVEAGEIGAPQ